MLGPSDFEPPDPVKMVTDRISLLISKQTDSASSIGASSCVVWGLAEGRIHKDFKAGSTNPGKVMPNKRSPSHWQRVPTSGEPSSRQSWGASTLLDFAYASFLT